MRDLRVCSIAGSPLDSALPKRYVDGVNISNVERNVFIVNIRPKKNSPRPYHHGNLRSALLSVASEILAEQGVTNLSLRGVARRAGVSQTAPYRHFRDKAALLAALAARGFGELAASMQQLAGASEPPGRLLATGQAYVAFALEKSALFRLMFGAEISDKGSYPELRKAANEAFAVLTREVAGQRRSEKQVYDRAVAAWSLVHGLATLLIDGQIRTDPIDAAALIRRFGRFLDVS